MGRFYRPVIELAPPSGGPAGALQLVPEQSRSKWCCVHIMLTPPMWSIPVAVFGRSVYADSRILCCGAPAFGRPGARCSARARRARAPARKLLGWRGFSSKQSRLEARANLEEWSRTDLQQQRKQSEEPYSCPLRTEGLCGRRRSWVRADCRPRSFCSDRLLMQLQNGDVRRDISAGSLRSLIRPRSYL